MMNGKARLDIKTEVWKYTVNAPPNCERRLAVVSRTARRGDKKARDYTGWKANTCSFHNNILNKKKTIFGWKVPQEVGKLTPVGATR